jgi:hypothetical protein
MCFFVTIITFQLYSSISYVKDLKVRALKNHELLSEKINDYEYKNCIKVFRDSSNIEFAHEFGLTYAKPKKDIASFIDTYKSFEDIYFYDPNIKQFFTVTGSRIEFEAFALHDRCVILIDVNEIKIIKE